MGIMVQFLHMDKQGQEKLTPWLVNLKTKKIKV